MIRRALSICSTYASLVAEFDEIRRIGQANDYPTSIIDTHWNGFESIHDEAKRRLLTNTRAHWVRQETNVCRDPLRSTDNRLDE
jgi:hypothetical protein